MPEGYFHRLNAQSATRFWINNPTVSEAKKAIAAGAISCTTNPAYVSKLLQKDESRTSVQEAIEPVIQTIPDDQVAADLVQRKLVKLIMDLFLPLYVNNQGKAGFVSIQGNPFMDEDTDHIIKEAIDVLEEQGLDVDIRHVMLVSDIMTATGEVRQIGRHGISGEKPSVLARAAFEITVPNIVEAAIKGESDPLKGVTENVIVGQSIPIGTGLVDLYMSAPPRGKNS